MRFQVKQMLTTYNEFFNPGRVAVLCSMAFGLFMVPAVADFASCKKTLTPYKAVYVSTYKGISMTGERHLSRKEEGRYILSHNARKMGNSISEQSEFTLRDNNIRVEKYNMTRSTVGVKREYHNKYDWDKSLVHVTGHVDVTLPLDNQPLDLLSYQLALRCDLEQGSQAASYPVVARNRLKNYEFRVSGKETLKTSLGELETLVVDRLRKKDDRTTRIWVAPEKNYLIVKLEQSESKDAASYKLEIKEVSFK